MNPGIQQYLQWMLDGKSYDEVRKDMLIRGNTVHEENETIKVLNSLLLIQKATRETHVHRRHWMAAGIVMVTISLLMFFISITYSSNGGAYLAIGVLTCALSILIWANKSVHISRIKFKRRIKRNFSQTR